MHLFRSTILISGYHHKLLLQVWSPQQILWAVWKFWVDLGDWSKKSTNLLANACKAVPKLQRYGNSARRENPIPFPYRNQTDRVMLFPNK